VLSTFIVAIHHPQMLGTMMPSDIVGTSSSEASDSDSMETHTNNPLLYYVMTADQGN